MKQSGFTLIEVLVTMFVLAVGILGAGSLQMVGFQSHQDAYFRTQAMYLAGDIVDRMRANPDGVDNTTAFDAVDTTAVIATAPSCKAAIGGCTSIQMAQVDIAEWAESFTVIPAVLPASSATVTRDAATNNFTITINWQEREWSGNSRNSSAQSYNLIVTL